VLIRARKVAPVLRSLRKDANVAAVVLHVNSPGGSALASDLLWREVEQLQQEKPVIAVFEDVAASGGYYLAAPAAEIIARPGTLTGSIGVFGGKLVVAGGMRKVGVHVQEISAAPNATLFSAGHPFTADQRVRFRASLQRFYDGFVQRVATGRRRSPEAVEPYCRGRVWTGKAANERGLIDRQGDLTDGEERARNLAGLSERNWRRVEWSTRKHGLLARALGGALRRTSPMGTSVGAGLEVVRAFLGDGVAALASLVLRHASEPLAMLPFYLRIR
jgi:protease-4